MIVLHHRLIATPKSSVGGPITPEEIHAVLEALIHLVQKDFSEKSPGITDFLEAVRYEKTLRPTMETWVDVFEKLIDKVPEAVGKDRLNGYFISAVTAAVPRLFADTISWGICRADASAQLSSQSVVYHLGCGQGDDAVPLFKSLGINPQTLLLVDPIFDSKKESEICQGLGFKTAVYTESKDGKNPTVYEDLLPATHIIMRNAEFNGLSGYSVWQMLGEAIKASVENNPWIIITTPTDQEFCPRSLHACLEDKLEGIPYKLSIAIENQVNPNLGGLMRGQQGYKEVTFVRDQYVTVFNVEHLTHNA